MNYKTIKCTEYVIWAGLRYVDTYVNVFGYVLHKSIHDINYLVIIALQDKQTNKITYVNYSC